MVNRKLDKYIERHYANSRSSLLLTGARQTGKTFAVRRYAKEYNLNLIEINFYEDESAKIIFEGVQSAKDVFNINYGAVYENLVAQELVAHGFGGNEHNLYYFNSKKQGSLIL